MIRSRTPKRPMLGKRKRPSSSQAHKRETEKSLDWAPKLNRHSKKLLEQIGTPEPHVFKPDDFQLKAVELIKNNDVLVSAPTGSGKTWIAIEATKAVLAQNGYVWYATPLKALSNSKLDEFGKILGSNNVGILTGDRKENKDAPVIVGTTEILRNQLYDSMHTGEDLKSSLVILDEAHYLGDTDRGVVWEEVLIYLPSRVRLLLLSATLSNATEIARWLSYIRGTSCKIVATYERPVPLKELFLAPTGELVPFLAGKRLFPTVSEIAKSQKGKKRFVKVQELDIPRIMKCLQDFNLLPAIFFFKSRSDCDTAVSQLAPTPIRADSDALNEMITIFLEKHPDFKNQRHIRSILTRRVAAHHAGHLPAWRLLVENMMINGFLDAIFSTSTVAAGVNFPARTVVIMQSDRFDGHKFVDMTATEFHQMTGRCGRRGIDNVGFILIVPSKYLDIGLVRELLLSKPEPLRSRININFSMTLNLLLSHDPAGVSELLEFSFASFREGPSKAKKITEKLVSDFSNHMEILIELGYVDETGKPTHDGSWAAKLRLDHPLLIAELIRSGAFRNVTYVELACLVAPFVVDKDREIHMSKELWARTRNLWRLFKKMVSSLKPVVRMMSLRGFETPTVMFWPAATVFLWSQDVDWEEINAHVSADEGDISMMLLRTADHLRQLLDLEKEEPIIASKALEAITKIMRPPLI